MLYESAITDFTGPGYFYLGYLFPLVAAVIVPISRMYLGSHSGNQILMGLTFGLGMTVLYRFIFQRWLYWVFERLMTSGKRLCVMLCLIPINLAVIAAPLIIYGISSDRRPIAQQFVDELSSKCSDTYTSTGLQGSDLVTGGMINIVFGAFYGIGCSDHFNYLYLYGYWRFVGETCCRKTGSFILKLLVEILLVMLPVGLLVIMANLLIENSYGSYFVFLVGVWLAAFSVTTFSNCLLVRWKIIYHVPPPEVA